MILYGFWNDFGVAIVVNGALEGMFGALGAILQVCWATFAPGFRENGSKIKF